MGESVGGYIRPYSSELDILKRIIDGFLIIAVLLLASGFYNQVWGEKYTVAAICAVVLFYIIAKINNLYISSRYWSASQEITPLLLSWISVVGGLLFLGYLFKVTHGYSRVVLGLWFLGTPMVLILWRVLLKKGMGYFRSKGYNSRTVTIVGTGTSACRLADNIRHMSWTGLTFLGFISVSGQGKGKDVLGDLSVLYEMKDQKKVDVIYIMLPMSEPHQIGTLLGALADSTVSIFLVPDFDLYGIAQGRWVTVGDTPTVSLVETPMLGFNAWLKRLEDIIVSLLAIIITTPIMAIIAIAIKLDSKGPVWYKQSRHGLNGKEILVLKFRSMKVMEADAEFQQAKRNDKRITLVGAFLRKTSLDELPQFFNVLLGDMSIVGPRPHALAHNAQFRGSILGYMRRHKVKPGLTGWAQVNGCRGETDTQEKMEARLYYDMEYLNNWSIWFDLKIIIMTPFVLIRGENAY